MLSHMSLLDWFRNVFSGPPHIAGSGDDPSEVAAVLGEEYGLHDEAAPDLRRIEATGGGGGLVQPGYGAFEAAETAEEDLASEEAPPDPDP
jgi:hypothetical protein